MKSLDESGKQKMFKQIADRLIQCDARIYGDFIYMPRKHNGIQTRAYEQTCRIEQSLRTELLWNHHGCSFGPAMSEFIKHHPDVLRLNINRTAWSFADGIYDGTQDVFSPHGSSNESIQTAHFIDQPVLPYINGAMDIPTPNIDRIIHPQLFQDINNPTEDEKHSELIFWALIGKTLSRH